MERDLIIEMMRSKLRFSNEVTIKDDYVRFTITRRMVNKFINSGKMNNNLIFNNIIILYNRYDITSYEIFKLLLKNHISIINPFFYFLGIIEDDSNMNSFVIEMIKDFASENYINDHLLKNY